MNWTHADALAPKILIHPPGAVSLDEAHDAIALWEHVSGKQLDPTQRLAVEVMMATDSADRWAASTTGREMPRQNGKGDEIEVVELWGMVMRAEAILHTIHDAVLLATQAQERMLGLFAHPDLRGKKAREWKGTGQQMIELRNGGQIWYRTRTGGGGRGLDQIDRVVVDEAQHATSAQMAAILPTLSMAANPQLNAIGTGAIAGHSEWWWKIRRRALSADPGSLGYVGHTAEDVSIDADGNVDQVLVDAADRSTWLACNPGFAAGRGGGMAFLEEEFRNLGPELFAQEHLCVWAPPASVVAIKAKIDPHWWRNCASLSTIAPPVVVGIDSGYDLTRSAVVVAGRQADTRRRVEVVQADNGAHWVELALLDVLEANTVAAVALDASGPARGLLPMVERVISDYNARQRADVDVVKLSTARYKAACDAFVSAARDEQLAHGSDPRLSNLAVSVPGRKIGDGWVWDRRGGDITPLVAATVALDAAESISVEQRMSVYESGELLTI